MRGLTDYHRMLIRDMKRRTRPNPRPKPEPVDFDAALEEFRQLTQQETPDGRAE